MVTAAWGIAMDVYDDVRAEFDASLVDEAKALPKGRAELMDALGVR